MGREANNTSFSLNTTSNNVLPSSKNNKENENGSKLITIINGVKVKTTGPVHNQRYKLKPCQHFEEHGNCPYNEKCQFAHGAAELEKWTNRRKREQQQQQQQQQQKPGSNKATTRVGGRRGSTSSMDSSNSLNSGSIGPVLKNSTSSSSNNNNNNLSIARGLPELGSSTINTIPNEYNNGNLSMVSSFSNDLFDESSLNIMLRNMNLDDILPIPKDDEAQQQQTPRLYGYSNISSPNTNDEPNPWRSTPNNSPEKMAPLSLLPPLRNEQKAGTTEQLFGMKTLFPSPLGNGNF